MYCAVLTGPTGGPRFALPGPGYFKEGRPAGSAPGGVPTRGEHTAGTRPPDFLCQEAQVHCARNRTPLKDRDVDKEDEEDGVQREDEEDVVTVERLMKKNMM